VNHTDSADRLLAAVDAMLRDHDETFLVDDHDDEPVYFAPSEEMAIRTCETVRPQRA